MLYNNDKPLLLFHHSCYIFFHYKMFFLFQAGDRQWSGGGGVLRQVQGLVSNMPVIFSLAAFVFHSRVSPFFQLIFSTNHVSMRPWVWKAQCIDPGSIVQIILPLSDSFVLQIVVLQLVPIIKLTWYFCGAYPLGVINLANTHSMHLCTLKSNFSLDSKKALVHENLCRMSNTQIWPHDLQINVGLQGG